MNQCDIIGKRAVDCIIYGISDRTLRSGALALRCSHPDNFLQYLVSNKSPQQSLLDRPDFRNKNTDNSNAFHPNSNSKQRAGVRPGPAHGCYNCKEKGHSFLYCPKPIKNAHDVTGSAI